MGPFAQGLGSNQVVTPAAASASVAIDGDDLSVRLVNTGANICYVRFGTGVVTATTADIPVRALSEVIVKKASGQDVAAHISASGTTLNIATGSGGV